MSDVSLFKMAMKKAKEDNEKKKDFGGFTFEFEDVKYCSVNVGEQKAFRFLGVPPEYRKDKYDSKIIYFSKIVKDDGKGYSEIL